MTGYLSSWENAEMLAFTDSGCCLHRPRQLVLRGFTGALMGRLVLNLPPHGHSHMYICEHGNTHCIDLQPLEEPPPTPEAMDRREEGDFSSSLAVTP
jgi:hypothetical protein